MKNIFLSIIAALIVGCTNPATWDSSINPLDKPMQEEYSIEDLHSQNISAITGNPTLNRTNDFGKTAR